MFYEVTVPEPQGEKVAALVTLNPPESRRLLAKAAVVLPEVKAAMAKHTIIIARGITNAYVIEELLGIKVERKGEHTVGIVTNGMTNANTTPPPVNAQVVKQGKVITDIEPKDAILSFGKDDVYIKGANAVDPMGNAGVMASSMKGGVWGLLTSIVTTRNSHLIILVGLEKLVPSVMDACNHSGIYYYKYSTGLPSKMSPFITGKVITEVQAFGLLAGIKAYHICSGGIGGSEGAVVLSLEGDEAHVLKALELVKSVKGEPPVMPPTALRVSSPAAYNYDALAQLATLKGI